MNDIVEVQMRTSFIEQIMLLSYIPTKLFAMRYQDTVWLNFDIQKEGVQNHFCQYHEVYKLVEKFSTILMADIGKRIHAIYQFLLYSFLPCYLHSYILIAVSGITFPEKLWLTHYS